MPEYFGHMRTLRRMIRRWGLASFFGSGANMREMSSWIQPTARLDREWDDDDRQVWGYTADHGTTTGYPAVAIFAQSKEVLLRRLDFICFNGATALVPFGSEVNVLTPPDGYNPVVTNPGEFFPFMQTTKATGAGGAPLSIPEARVVGGENAALMAVTIGGVLVNPALGPRQRARIQERNLGAVGAVFYPDHGTLWDWDDPPVIIPPWRVLGVQWHNMPQGTGQLHYVQTEIYLSERVTA